MNLSNKIDALKKLGLTELRQEFLRVMGRPTNSGDKQGMVQKIAERLGDKPPAGSAETTTAPAAPERAKGKAKRAPTPTEGEKASPFTSDPRLPAPGSTISVTHKKKTYECKYLGEPGFDYEGKRYRSLSSLASEILGGVSVNGFLWWGLVKRPAPAAKAEKPAAPKAKRATKGKRAPRAKSSPKKS